MKKPTEMIRDERLRVQRPCDNFIVASLWPKKGENLGTLARTCDAVGASLAVPRDREAIKAVKKGNTIGLHNSNIIEIDIDPIEWLSQQKDAGIYGVELATEAIPLCEVTNVFTKTIVLLGHEATGIPDEAWPFVDVFVEIPMQGVGNSLNVAVAGSLVLYKLAGLV